MLQAEGVRPHDIAYDRPSPKLLAFLRKHYRLSNYVKQSNNYVVFDQYFHTQDHGHGVNSRRQDTKRPLTREKRQRRGGEPARGGHCGHDQPPAMGGFGGGRPPLPGPRRGNLNELNASSLNAPWSAHDEPARLPRRHERHEVGTRTPFATHTAPSLLGSLGRCDSG
jgi:hypothetical protein